MKVRAGAIFFLIAALGALGIAYWVHEKDLIFLLLLSVIVLSGWVFLSQGIKTAMEIAIASLPISVPANLLLKAEMLLPGEFLLAVVALSLLVFVIVHRRFGVVLKYPLPALWVFTLFLASFWSEIPIVSVKFATINGLYVWVFYYGVQIYLQEGGLFSKLVGLFGLAMIPAGVWGLWQFVQFEFNPITVRGLFEPFFYSHTYFGATAAILSGYYAGRAFEDRKWGMIAVFCIFITIASQSRAALWSLLFMGLVTSYMFLKPWLKWALPIVGMVAIAILSKPEQWVKLFEQSAFESHNPQASLAEKTLSVTNVTTDVSNVERLNRWISALRMFKERPHHGFGPGTYQFTYIPYQEPALENRLTVKNPDSPPEGSGGTAHSEWLLQLSECGWPTFVLFVALMIQWFFIAFGTKSPKKWALPLAMGLLTYYFHMHFNNFLNQAAFGFLFWSFGGMLHYSSNPTSICTITAK